MLTTGLMVLLVVASVTAVTVHLGQIAFELTGLPKHKAFFQSLSCFTTTGFTTREAEEIVNHPKRRTIAVTLMIMGNVGIVAFMAAIVETVMKEGMPSMGRDALIMLGVLLVSFFLIRILPPFKSANRALRRVLMNVFSFEPDPTEQILNYADGFGVVRVEVREGSPAAGKQIRNAGIAHRGVVILSIEREGRNYPVPGPRARLEMGDRLVCYARIDKADEVINGSAPLGDAEGELKDRSQFLKAFDPSKFDMADTTGARMAVQPEPSAAAPPPPPSAEEEEDLGRGMTIMRQAYRLHGGTDPSENS